MMLTIFTPTYNRADKLERIFISLCKQNCLDFEWLIIDDGSTDHTQDVVKSFMKAAPFSIRYCFQNNGGKHRAYNRALMLARGEFLFCVDSDDWLPEHAVRYIEAASKDLISKQYIVAYKLDEKGRQLSGEFPDAPVTSIRELDEKYRCNGEFSLVFPMGLARQYPFPEFDGERFITESVVYDRIDLAAQPKLLPKTLTICEYQSEGLTNNLNKIMKNNPAGYCLFFVQRIDIQSSFVKRVICAGKYQCFCLFAGNKKTTYNGRHRFLVTLSTPVGWAFACYYKWRRGF